MDALPELRRLPEIRLQEEVSPIPSRLALMAALLATPSLTLLDGTPASAHAKGMFRTRQEAEQRAAELRCKGAFRMGSMWMPCANEQALHKDLQNE